MKLALLSSLVLVVASVVACGDDDSSSSSTSKYTCKLNGACYSCPSSDAVLQCAKESPSAAKCTAAADSVCN